MKPYMCVIANPFTLSDETMTRNIFKTDDIFDTNNVRIFKEIAKEKMGDV